jgi:hypothetical protein
MRESSVTMFARDNPDAVTTSNFPSSTRASGDSIIPPPA